MQLKLASIAFLTVLTVGLAQYASADRLELIRHVSLWRDSSVRSPDTSGITYHGPSGRLLIADSEVSEYGEAVDAAGARIFSGLNVFEVSLDLRTRYAAHWVAPAGSSVAEPVGITYNPADGHVYVTDDDRRKIFRHPFDGARKFGAPVAEIPTGIDDRRTDPEGIACDPATGVLYVVSGSKEERVLKFRFDPDGNLFEFLGEFSVAEQIRDPEGIGIDPATGNLFLVSGRGIAEFRTDGTFVQGFDYRFLDGTGVTWRLPGGLVFAPSSDPNDPQDTYSIYVTCRGIDNGRYPERDSLDGAVSELRLVRDPVLAQALRVPADYPTIQAALDAAPDGSTIIVAPGVYAESLTLTDRTVILASEHLLTGRPELIDQTIIDGNGKEHVISVPKTVGAGTTITGFTLRNADDGITARGVFTLTHCHITQTADGIDYEAGGGLVRYCRFTENRDDGVDLDGATGAVIEHCQITDNRDDGIEIRLHPYTGDTLHIRISGNRIERNREDGIQLIDYDGLSDREFVIEGNFIAANAMAGIGCMAEGNTREDYSGAAIPEPVHVFNNTFVGNTCHLTGGHNLLAVNKIFANASTMAVKNTAGRSLVSHNLFWGNAAEQQDSNVDSVTVRRADPLLGADHRLLEQSPAVDAGTGKVTWHGEEKRVVAPAEYRGKAPDLGAFEVR